MRRREFIAAAQHRAKSLRDSPFPCGSSARTPQIRRHAFTPALAFVYNSSFLPGSGSGPCPLVLFRPGLEPCEDVRT
jgi:hypothetical protein